MYKYRKLVKYIVCVAIILYPIIVAAQRDYGLTEGRNHWLLSDNVAAMVTYSDSSISKADVSLGYTNGDYRGMSDGKNELAVNADVRSYYRLSDKVMSYGAVSYSNYSGNDMYGSMFAYSRMGEMQMGYNDNVLNPFDLVQYADDAGRKHLEIINVVGGVGWNIWRGLSIGAKADFMAGNYSKYKDLRHANSLMHLNAKGSVFYRFGKPSLGATILYDRSTETVKYKTYGTTDHIYTVLLDYANQMGETITYGGDGFIDDNTELPLYDERYGFAVDAAWQMNDQPSPRGCRNRGWGIGFSFSYLHRNGYYGKQTQYTASYEQHKGDKYGYSLRLNLPQTDKTLSWLDVRFNSEGLTSYKTNYRQVKSTQNSSVNYYEYYAATKMSDKVRDNASVAYSLYINPKGAIYLWNINAGVGYLYSKQTAYMYPDKNTRTATLWMPFAKAKRNIVLANTGVLSMQLGLGCNMGSMDIMMDGVGRQVCESVAVSYEMPLLSLRSNISLSYSCAESTDKAYNHLSRHHLMLSFGAIF